MSNWYDEEDFYEPDAIEIAAYEFRETLEKSVKKSVVDEIESLKKRIAELEDFAKAKKEYETEIRSLNWKLEATQREVEERAKQLRLPEIMKALESPAWIADWTFDYIHPKCDKCDDRRRIHFKSPSGRDFDEECSCAERRCTYSPVQGVMVKFRWDKDVWNWNHECDELRGGRFTFIRPETFKKDYIDKDESSYRIDVQEFYYGQPFEELAKNHSRPYFRDFDKCKEFCDYMNSLEKD